MKPNASTHHATMHFLLEQYGNKLHEMAGHADWTLYFFRVRVDRKRDEPIGLLYILAMAFMKL